MVVDGLPLHNTWLAGVLSAGVGLTVILKLMLLPLQPFADGVTTIAASWGVSPVLLAVKEAILPTPADASPMEPALLVQL